MLVAHPLAQLGRGQVRRCQDLGQEMSGGRSGVGRGRSGDAGSCSAYRQRVLCILGHNQFCALPGVHAVAGVGRGLARDLGKAWFGLVSAGLPRSSVLRYYWQCSEQGPFRTRQASVGSWGTEVQAGVRNSLRIVDSDACTSLP